MTATCATCRWWQRSTEDDGGLLYGMVRNAGEELDFYAPWDWTPEDQAKAEAIRARIGKCGSPKLHFYVLPQRGEAAVVDGSEYKAELCTDGKFGCTNHDASDTP